MSGAFDGIKVSTTKKVIFILANNSSFPAFIATVLHELGAHVCEECDHETFGSAANFYEMPNATTTDSTADVLNNELKTVQKTSLYKTISNKLLNIISIPAKEEKKKASKAE